MRALELNASIEMNAEGIGSDKFLDSENVPKRMLSEDTVVIRLLRLWRMVGKDLHLLRFALVHPRRPSWLVPALVFLALYALDPINFALPFVGAIDDVLLVPMVLHLLLRLLPAHIRSSYRDLPNRQALVSRMTKAWSPER